MKKKHKIRLIALFLFLLNLVPGLLLINEGLFHYDAVRLAEAVEKTYRTGSLQPAVSYRYGSVVLAGTVYLPFFVLGQNADFAVRFSGVLFHSLSVTALFLLALEIFNGIPAALFSALLFSFIPFYFSTNTTGKEHGMAMFFILMALYYLSKGVRRKSALQTGFSGVLFVFAITVRESVLPLLPLYFMFYGVSVASSKPKEKSLAAEAADPKMLAALILPFSVLFLFVLLWYGGEEYYRALFTRDTAYRGFLGPFSRMLQRALHDLSTSIPWLFFFFSAAGLYKIFSSRQFLTGVFLTLWIGLFFYYGNVTVYTSRHLDIIVVPLCLTAAYGMALLYREKPFWAVAALIFCVGSMFLFTAPMLAFRHRYNGEKRFAEFVKKNTEPDAMVLAMDDTPFIEYYAQRQVLGHPVGDREAMNALGGQLAQLMRRGRSVYLIPSAFQYDADGFFRRMISERFDLEYVGEALYEDFHRPELRLRVFKQKFFRLREKNSNHPDGQLGRALYNKAFLKGGIDANL